MARISESQLVLPALLLMSLSNNKSISTTMLIQELRRLLKPSGEDIMILAGRRDDKFSQKVRNLKSHSTFEKLNFATYAGSIVTISSKGEKFLNKNIDKLQYLLVNDFAWDDIKGALDVVNTSEAQNRKIELFDETLMIQEGYKKLTQSKTYTRSAKLRKMAINHYKRDGDIFCEACNFSFREFYGEFGDGFIEIHHVKPVFKYEDEELDKTIEEALENVIPVCSNCHRMIHINWKEPLEIDFLISQIMRYGKHKVK